MTGVIHLCEHAYMTTTTTTHPPTYVPELGDRVALTVHTLRESTDVTGTIVAVVYSIRRRRPMRVTVDTLEHGELCPELDKLRPIGGAR